MREDRLFIVIVDTLYHVRNTIVYVLSWRTVYALTRVLFWCLFPSLLRNSGLKSIYISKRGLSSYLGIKYQHEELRTFILISYIYVIRTQCDNVIIDEVWWIIDQSFVTVCTGCCQNGNLQRSQWQKLLQYNDISASVKWCPLDHQVDYYSLIIELGSWHFHWLACKNVRFN